MNIIKPTNTQYHFLTLTQLKMNIHSISIEEAALSYTSLLLLLQFFFLPSQSHAQQSYVNNKQLKCENNYTTTLGYVCNGAATSCPSYLTFRSTNTYNNPATIAYLLAADASEIAAANNISAVDSLPVDTLLVVPVNCSCSGGNYYQHNASYVIKVQGESYFTVANTTYQSLTTCQSMIAQNHYETRQLFLNSRLTVPLRCACPTAKQMALGFRYLLTYLIRQGNDSTSIAGAFSGAGADVHGILEANELSANQVIFYFTPILVPLKTEPTKESINTMAQPPPPSPPALPTNPATQSSDSSRKSIFIGVGIGVAVLTLVLASSFMVWFFRHCHKSPAPPLKLADGSSKAEDLSSWSLSSEGIRIAIESLTIYKFEELEKATGSFSEANRISGSSVYRGSFKGDNAAVKIMKGDVSREIDVLRQINHSHVIRLSGFCLHQGITYLVYEYAKNGSLRDCLNNRDYSNDKCYDSPSIIGCRQLDWKQRVQIAYDVADALNYLHNFTNPPYIHKNLKSSNILLDGNMRAKITNFSLARTLDNKDENTMTRHVVGTYGYLAPEYIENGLVTPKLDVFALGVVMLELLSSRESTSNIVVSRYKTTKEENGDQMLLSEIIEKVFGGGNVREKLHEFMDPCLREEYPMELAYSMAQLARSCVSHNLNDRPLVYQVLMALSQLLSSSLDWDPSHDLQHSTSLSLRD